MEKMIRAFAVFLGIFAVVATGFSSGMAAAKDDIAKGGLAAIAATCFLLMLLILVLWIKEQIVEELQKKS